MCSALPGSFSRCAGRCRARELRSRTAPIPAGGVSPDICARRRGKRIGTDNRRSVRSRRRRGWQRQADRRAGREGQGGYDGSQTGQCLGVGTEFDGPWLAGSCENLPDGSYVENLYSLANGSWRSIPMPQDCFHNGYYGESGGTLCDPGPAGADWVTWTELCWNCDGQSTQTGALPLTPNDAPLRRIPHTSATEVIDLGSRTMIRSLCRPLRNTAGNHLDVDPSTGMFNAGAGVATGPFAIAKTPQSRYFLERCGSALDERLPGAPVGGNSSELLFYNPAGCHVERAVSAQPSTVRDRRSGQAAHTATQPSCDQRGSPQLANDLRRRPRSAALESIGTAQAPVNPRSVAGCAGDG